jgi:predicted TPR repeat methyltransferase
MLDHRKAVGGHWDEVGRRLLRTLVDLDLEPHHRVLEFGCGSLRCGHQIIRHLDPSCYFGIEIDRRLLETGIEKELPDSLVEEKKPTFAINGRLRLAPEDESKQFDFIVSNAVFTHFGPEALERFLIFSQSKMILSGGKVVLSLHISSDEKLDLGTLVHYPPSSEPVTDIRNLHVFAMRDKVFYPRYLLQQIANRLWLDMTILPWRHPGKNNRNQRMLLFVPTTCGQG